MEYKLTINDQECESLGFVLAQEGDYCAGINGHFQRLTKRDFGKSEYKVFRPICKERTFGSVTFLETGEYRLPRKGEWFLSPYGTPQWADSDYTLPYKILRVNEVRA